MMMKILVSGDVVDCCCGDSHYLWMFLDHVLFMLMVHIDHCASY